MTIPARPSTYPLRLPAPIKAEAERLAAAEGTSLNRFVASAVAEKVAALRTAGRPPRRAQGPRRLGRFDRLVTRPGGEPPRPSDEPPPERP